MLGNQPFLIYKMLSYIDCTALYHHCRHLLLCSTFGETLLTAVLLSIYSVDVILLTSCLILLTIGNSYFCWVTRNSYHCDCTGENDTCRFSVKTRSFILYKTESCHFKFCDNELMFVNSLNIDRNAKDHQVLWVCIQTMEILYFVPYQVSPPANFQN